MMKDLIAVGVLAMVALSAPVRAEYPDRPVRLIVPFAPGGANDSVARPFSDKLGKVLSRSVIVEDNRAAPIDSSTCLANFALSNSCTPSSAK